MGTGLKIATALMFATIMTGPVISELGNEDAEKFKK